MGSNSFLSSGENVQSLLSLDFKSSEKMTLLENDQRVLSVEISDNVGSSKIKENQNLKRGVKRKLKQCDEDNQNSYKKAPEISIFNREYNSVNYNNRKDFIHKNDNVGKSYNDTHDSSKIKIYDDESQSCGSSSSESHNITKLEGSSYSHSSQSASCRKVYGLRSRSGHRKSWIDDQVDNRAKEATPNEKNGGQIDSTDSQAENKELKPRLWSKGRSKNSRSKPLSKYRRITANARERDRMKEINTAFTALRGVLPTYTNSQINNMTKYSTLQLAVSYIKGLSDLPNETNNAVNESVKGESCSEESADTSNRNVNLSVGISEIKCGSVASTDCEQKPSDFLMFSKSSNFNFTHENIQGLEDFENLPEMSWAFDLMVD